MAANLVSGLVLLLLAVGETTFMREQRSPFSPFSPPTTSQLRTFDLSFATPATTTRPTSISKTRPTKASDPSGRDWQRSASGKSVWALNCDFEGNSDKTTKITLENCIKICEERFSCSHFTWAPVRQGTCWLRSGEVTSQDASDRRAPGKSKF